MPQNHHESHCLRINNMGMLVFRIVAAIAAQDQNDRCDRHRVQCLQPPAKLHLIKEHYKRLENGVRPRSWRNHPFGIDRQARFIAHRRGQRLIGNREPLVLPWIV